MAVTAVQSSVVVFGLCTSREKGDIDFILEWQRGFCNVECSADAFSRSIGKVSTSTHCSETHVWHNYCLGSAVEELDGKVQSHKKSIDHKILGAC